MKRKNIVIIMMGFTAVGKTTVALKIAEKLKADIYHSAVTRKEFDLSPSKEEASGDFFDLTSGKRLAMDKIVYGENAKRAFSSLAKGNNVVLDAGHFFLWQRTQIYELTQSFEPEFVVVRVVCEEDELKRRIQTRLDKYGESPWNEAPSLIAYESCKEATEYPDNLDRIPSGSSPSILEIDSLQKKIKIVGSAANSSFLDEIVAQIRAILTT